MGTKVKKTKPEEVIPAKEINGEIRQRAITFGSNGEHTIVIKTTGDIERRTIVWDEMTQKQRKECEDAFDACVADLDVEVVIGTETKGVAK
jgi:hypothetical protein